MGYRFVVTNRDSKNITSLTRVMSTETCNMVVKSGVLYVVGFSTETWRVWRKKLSDADVEDSNIVISKGALGLIATEGCWEIKIEEDFVYIRRIRDEQIVIDVRLNYNIELESHAKNVMKYVEAHEKAPSEGVDFYGINVLSKLSKVLSLGGCNGVAISNGLMYTEGNGFKVWGNFPDESWSTALTDLMVKNLVNDSEKSKSIRLHDYDEYLIHEKAVLKKVECTPEDFAVSAKSTGDDFLDELLDGSEKEEVEDRPKYKMIADDSVGKLIIGYRKMYVKTDFHDSMFEEFETLAEWDCDIQEFMYLCNCVYTQKSDSKVTFYPNNNALKIVDSDMKSTANFTCTPRKKDCGLIESFVCDCNGLAKTLKSVQNPKMEYKDRVRITLYENDIIKITTVEKVCVGFVCESTEGAYI